MLDADAMLLHRQAEFRAYAYRNVNVVIWQSTMTLESVRVANEMHARRHRQLGRRLSLISVLTPQVDFPDSQVRGEIHALQTRWREGIGCFVAVLEAEGMWRSAVRGFMTAIQALAPNSDGRLHLASSLSAAATWLVGPHARVTGMNLDRSDLRTFLENARRAASDLTTLRSAQI